jgi:hypothetical protein
LYTARQLTADGLFGQKGTMQITPHPTLAAQIGRHLVVNVRLRATASVDKDAPITKTNIVITQLGTSLAFLVSLDDPETVALVPPEYNRICELFAAKYCNKMQFLQLLWKAIAM